MLPKAAAMGNSMVALEPGPSCQLGQQMLPRATAVMGNKHLDVVTSNLKAEASGTLP